MYVKEILKDLKTLEVICQILYYCNSSVNNELNKLAKKIGPIISYFKNFDNLNSKQKKFNKLGFSIEELNNNINFDDIKKYDELDTDENIPIEFYVKLKNKKTFLIKKVEKTNAKKRIY